MQTSFLTKRKIIGNRYIISKMEENVNINKINQKNKNSQVKNEKILINERIDELMKICGR